MDRKPCFDDELRKGDLERPIHERVIAGYSCSHCELDDVTSCMRIAWHSDMSHFKAARRRIPFFPVFPLVPLALLAVNVTALVTLFRRVRRLELNAEGI